MLSEAAIYAPLSSHAVLMTKYASCGRLSYGAQRPKWSKNVHYSDWGGSHLKPTAFYMPGPCTNFVRRRKRVAKSVEAVGKCAASPIPPTLAAQIVKLIIDERLQARTSPSSLIATLPLITMSSLDIRGRRLHLHMGDLLITLKMTTDGRVQRLDSKGVWVGTLVVQLPGERPRGVDIRDSLLTAVFPRLKDREDAFVYIAGEDRLLCPRLLAGDYTGGKDVQVELVDVALLGKRRVIRRQLDTLSLYERAFVTGFKESPDLRVDVDVAKRLRLPGPVMRELP
jgi:hypothetical protein